MASMLLSSGTGAISSGFAIIFLFVPDLMQLCSFQEHTTRVASKGINNQKLLEKLIPWEQLIKQYSPNG